MSKNRREIIEARRAMPSLVNQTLKPLEESTTAVAIQSARFAALLLTAHGDAALPPSVGAAAIRLVAEAAQLAAASRAKIAEAHDELRSIQEMFFPMSGPECPPNDFMSSPLRVAA